MAGQDRDSLPSELPPNDSEEHHEAGLDANPRENQGPEPSVDRVETSAAQVAGHSVVNSSPSNAPNAGETEAIQKVEEPMVRLTAALVWWTRVMAACAALNVVVIFLQLREMHSGGVDTHDLAIAAQSSAVAAGEQAAETRNLLKATEAEAAAASSQAAAMDRLRDAGQAQAKAMESLRTAGENQAAAAADLAKAGRSQANATRSLAANGANQLAAIQASADAGKAQAAALVRSADATVTASKATDTLAKAGQEQASAVLQSVTAAHEANGIASAASEAASRPWISIDPPGGEHEPVVGQEYRVDVPVFNTGRSPALNVRVLVSVNIYDVNNVPMIPEECKNNCRSQTIFPTTQLGAGGQIFHPFLEAARMTPEVTDDIKNFKKAIVIHAHAEYSDANDQPHHTTLCAYYLPKSQRLGSFTACPSGKFAN